VSILPFANCAILSKFCLEQADESATPEGQAVLRSLADNYAAGAGLTGCITPASDIGTSIDPAAPGASHLDARFVGRPFGPPGSPVKEPAGDVGNGLPDPVHNKLTHAGLERPYLPGRSLRQSVGLWGA
jgi:hypothetical protein